LIKLPFGYFIGKQKQPEPTVYFVRRQQPEPQPTMSKYEFDKLYPKSWKTGIWIQKPWQAQGMSWSDWRYHQAELAVAYYAQGNCSQQHCADKFGISINAFVHAWSVYKKHNGVVTV